MSLFNLKRAKFTLDSKSQEMLDRIRKEQLKDFTIRFYCFYDTVRGEMIFSPFQSYNDACAVRQAQELIESHSVKFPSDLEDIELMFCFLMNPKEVVVDQLDTYTLSRLDEESLKHAYQRFKEVK